MTKALLATWGAVFPLGKLDFMKPLKLQNHKNLRRKSTVATKNHNMPTALDGAMAVTLWECVCVCVCVCVCARVWVSVYAIEKGFSGGWAVALRCWQACDSAAIEDKTQRGQASSILGLLFRRRPQGNTAEQTEHTDFRGTELPACPNALSFITAATDATSPPPPPPLCLPRSLPPEISISQSSSTSPTSRSRHPSSALQRQTNSAIWSKSRKDHCRIFSHNVMVLLQRATEPTNQSQKSYCNTSLYQLRENIMIFALIYAIRNLNH